MQTTLGRLDELAGIESDWGVARWLERVAFAFLILMAIAAPHSIAATQTAWITGMFVWIVRLFFKPRVRFRLGPLDIALWAFFFWSVITSLTSYAPDISANKLRGVAVFLIFYFVFYNLRTRRAAHVLAFVLIASCMANVLWTPVQRLMGRGVEIQGVAPHSPLTKAILVDGDTLLEANGRKLTTPEDVVAALEQTETSTVKFYRPDFEFVVEVKRADLLDGVTASERLGITSWKKSRNWRSSGFYGHYTTYSEVLQLIASLVLGLLVALWRAGTRRRVVSFLAFSLVMMTIALLLTVTRASQLAFLVSGAAIALIGLGRRWFLAAVAIGLPLALIGLFFLQQSRQVGFFDPKDDSTRWRQTVWWEGVNLWTENPRHFFLGVGMDSIKRHASDWHLFDDGRLPVGHFHSTPVNLVVERGLPALLLWLMILGVYARALWRPLTDPKSKIEDSISQGVLLGSLGGMIGFVVSGLVHYNLGDQEVAMVFFLLMGLGMSTIRLEPEKR
jgi:hypothetical protein